MSTGSVATREDGAGAAEASAGGGWIGVSSSDIGSATLDSSLNRSIQDAFCSALSKPAISEIRQSAVSLERLNANIAPLLPFLSLIGSVITQHFSWLAASHASETRAFAKSKTSRILVQP